MSQCAKCGEALPEDAKFCSNCGAKVEAAAASQCRHCGSTLKPMALFCHSCGQSVDGSDPAIHRPATAESPATGASETEDEAGEGELEFRAGGRSWKTILLPLVGIPVLVGIIFLLTYKQQNPKPISASAGTAQSEGEGQGVDMAAMEQVSQQIAKYKSDLQANPKDTTALLALGGMYEIASRFDEAADYYRRYLEVEPGNLQVRMSLAGVYYNHNQRQLALNEIQQVLKRQPNYDYAMYNLGVIYLAEGKKDEAIKWWHKVIEANPSGELAHSAREQIKATAGQ